MEVPLVDAIGSDLDELLGILRPWTTAIVKAGIAGGGYPGDAARHQRDGPRAELDFDAKSSRESPVRISTSGTCCVTDRLLGAGCRTPGLAAAEGDSE